MIDVPEMTKKSILVAIILCLFLGCYGEEEPDCVDDYEYETPDYGGHCTLDMLGIFQKDNPITNNKLCCEGEKHLHDTGEGAGFRSCDKINEAYGFVCAGSINHSSSINHTLKECRDPCELQLLNIGNFPMKATSDLLSLGSMTHRMHTHA